MQLSQSIKSKAPIVFTLGPIYIYENKEIKKNYLSTFCRNLLSILESKSLSIYCFIATNGRHLTANFSLRMLRK